MLNSATAQADLAAAPVVLPDFHHKHDLEMPSSIAVATLGTIRPEFTSASVNCGMALMAMDMEVPGRSGAAALLRRGAPPLPAPAGLAAGNCPVRDVLSCAEQGAEFGVERYGLHPEALERIEEGGRLDLDRYGGVQRLRRELPALSFHVSRLRFGTIGPSNHFVELQVVDEILDPAGRGGPGSGGRTADDAVPLRRRPAHRPGGTALRPAQEDVEAARADHGGRPAARASGHRPLDGRKLRQRLELYFTDGCPTIPVEGSEGERVLLANAAAMNYGFAFRTATYGTLSRLARDVFGARDVRLVVDSPHNSIYEETDRRPAGHRAPAQRLPGLPGVDDAARHGVRQRRPGPPGTGHAPHLLLPLRGRRRSRTKPVLRLPRRRNAHQPVRNLRPVWPGHTAPDALCASATARTSPPQCRNLTTAASTRRWRS